MIPKLAKGGIIPNPPISSITPDEYIYGLFMTHQEMIEKIEHQKKIIDRLSRKIQNKNKKYRQLQARKMPPTFMGREVIIIPDSICKEILVMDKNAFEYATKVVNDYERKQ